MEAGGSGEAVNKASLMYIMSNLVPSHSQILSSQLSCSCKMGVAWDEATHVINAGISPLTWARDYL